MNREEIIRMAREAGLPKWYQDNALANESLVLKFAALVAAAEREECARLNQSYVVTGIGKEMAAAIRAKDWHE